MNTNSDSTKDRTESLAGQTARIVKDGKETTVKFAADVVLIRAGGHQTGSKELEIPEITGCFENEVDFPSIIGAELILEDRNIFEIKFYQRRRFFASQPVSSRQTEQS
jgi:hypothetical protein